MDNSKNLAPMKLELLMAVVHNERVSYFASIIQSHKANLQLSIPARGTTQLILNYLGLTDRPKTLIMSVVRADEAQSLIDELDETFHKPGKNLKGVAFTVSLTSIIGTNVYGFLCNDKRAFKTTEDGKDE